MCVCVCETERKRQFFWKNFVKVNSMEANEGTAGCVYSVLFTLAATSLVEFHKSLCWLLLQSDWFSVFALELCRLLKTSDTFFFFFLQNNSYFPILHPRDRILSFYIFPWGVLARSATDAIKLSFWGHFNCILLCLCKYVVCPD